MQPWRLAPSEQISPEIASHITVHYIQVLRYFGAPERHYWTSDSNEPRATGYSRISLSRISARQRLSSPLVSSVCPFLRRYTASGTREKEGEMRGELRPTYTLSSLPHPSVRTGLLSLLSLSFSLAFLPHIAAMFRRTIETNRLIQSNVRRPRRLSSKDTIGCLYTSRLVALAYSPFLFSPCAVHRTWRTSWASTRA